MQRVSRGYVNKCREGSQSYVNVAGAKWGRGCCRQNKCFSSSGFTESFIPLNGSFKTDPSYLERSQGATVY